MEREPDGIGIWKNRMENRKKEREEKAGLLGPIILICDVSKISGTGYLLKELTFTSSNNSNHRLIDAMNFFN